MSNAFAQNAKPTEKAKAGELETITVTAERRAENIQDVPSSISALRGTHSTPSTPVVKIFVCWQHACPA
jgi:hypothetical protein